MIDETKVKSNRELLEAATSFKFPGYRHVDKKFGINCDIDLIIEKTLDETWIISSCHGVYDYNMKEFRSLYLPCFTELKPNYEGVAFDSEYDALEVVKELIK